MRFWMKLASERVVTRADEAGLRHTPLESASPCIIGVGLPDDSPNDIGRRLADQKIGISVGKNKARIATHVYNTTEDIDRLFDTLNTLK